MPTTCSHHRQPGLCSCWAPFCELGVLEKVMYQDKTDPLLCLQVWGSKRVRIYPPAARPLLYPFPARGVLRNTSQVDSTDAADSARFSGFAEVPFLETVLKPGEALFLPPQHWHEVVALDSSLSLSFWWT